MYKRVIWLGLALGVLLTLAGCTGGSKNKPSYDGAPITTAPVDVKAQEQGEKNLLKPVDPKGKAITNEPAPAAPGNEGAAPGTAAKN